MTWLFLGCAVLIAWIWIELSRAPMIDESQCPYIEMLGTKCGGPCEEHPACMKGEQR
jgi:hypothetical protein